MFVSSGVYYDLIEILVIFLIGLVLYFKWSFTYWKKRGLDYLEPSIPFGNSRRFLTSKCSFAEQFAELYHKLKKRDLKHGGVFLMNRPFYIPVDPTIIKDILQKDFSHFVDRGFYVNEEVDPLGGHLFSLEGSKWKNLRAKLTATFTSGKMKMMFETILECAKELDDIMHTAAISKKPIDIRDVLARFTIDVISSCAFGLDGNSLKDTNSPLYYYGKRATQNTPFENLKLFSQLFISTKVFDALKIKITKSDVEDFMLSLVKRTVDYREKNSIYRKDFLHLLLQLKNKGKLTDDESVLKDNSKTGEVGFTVNELAAQVFVFFIAGYETSATTLTYTLFELCMNQEIQEKLRNEICSVLQKHKNEISYEAIMEMTYMDQVLNETLRKYPPLAFLNRKCTKPYKISGSDVCLEEGTMVVIPTLGLQHDPEYYPEPSKYDPDRFLEVNKSKRPPFTWMPFGEGPRICIGLRFGLLQSKIGLASLLKNYKVTLNEKTKTPLSINANNFLISPKETIWLNVSKTN